MGAKVYTIAAIAFHAFSFASADSMPDSCASRILYHSMYRLYEVRRVIPSGEGCPTGSGPDTVALDISPPSMIESSFEPNYMTFGGWLNLPTSDYGGLWHPLIFESRITPNFEAVYGSVMLDIVPGFLVRMRAEYSHPVYTPSFLPSVRLYTWNRQKVMRLNLGKTFQDFSYWGLSLNHHSNGESGGFYNPDGTVDTVRGSFGTNFIIVEYHNWSQFNLAIPFLGRGRTFIDANDIAFELEVHPPNPPGRLWFHDPVLDEQFGPIRPHFKAVIYQRSPFNSSTYAKAWFNFSYAFPRKYRIAPEPALGLAGKRARVWEDHFTVDLEETFFLSWLDPLGVYAAYHAGPDYYNIWYRNYVQMIRFGIAVDPGNRFWVAGMK